ncbi:MAG: hypothetical protein EOM24_36025, partial [Chloroflexia bacterium]|nr:hypothetical protein [Chloroflexia bacterium]
MLSDTYRVEFIPSFAADPATTAYLSEFYNKQASSTDATPVPLPIGATATIDGSLQRGALFAGLITAADNAIPLVGVSVQVYDASGTVVANRTTNASGQYTTTGLISGTYRLAFVTRFANNATTRAYLSQFYDVQPDLSSATTIVVTAPEVKRINQALPRGAVITGRVTAQGELANEAGIPDVNVRAYRGLDNFSSWSTAQTDATGTYTLTGLATDSYIISFEPTEPVTTTGYVSLWYNQQPDREVADLVGSFCLRARMNARYCSDISFVEQLGAVVFELAPIIKQSEAALSRLGILGILQQLKDEMRFVWVEVFEDIEVDVTLVGIEAVLKLLALCAQRPQELLAFSPLVVT